MDCGAENRSLVVRRRLRQVRNASARPDYDADLARRHHDTLASGHRLVRIGDFVSAAPPILDTDLSDLTLVRRGKVRDVYAVDDALVMIATDRISAFDYVLGSGIPDKGRVLTQLSAFWFNRTRHIVANHLLSASVADYPAAAARAYATLLDGPVDAGPPHDARCRSSASPAATSRDRAGRTTRPPGAVCGHHLPPGLRRIGSAARAALHAGDQGRVRPRREHQRGGSRRRSSAPSLLARLKRAHAGALRVRCGACRVAAASSSPTPSSSSG